MAMLPKSVLTLLLVFVAFHATTCQDAEDAPLDVGGSGDGPAELNVAPSNVEAPLIDEDNLEDTINVLNAIDSLNVESTIKPDTPILDEEEDKAVLTSFVDGDLKTNISACDICTCDENDDGFVVDCSHKSLTEVPERIDERATVLDLEYNRLETLPKSIGTLKNLINLNANNNLLKDIEYGAVSTLSNLQTLNFANNKFTELPQDLKNSFALIELTNLALSGNNLSEISAETFAQFKSLKTIKLDNVTDELTKELCTLANISLEEVCKGDDCIKCHFLNDDFPVHPGMIAVDNEDYLVSETTTLSPVNGTTSTPITNATTEFNLKNAVDKEVHSRKAVHPTEENKKGDIKAETEVKVGATTNEENSGGVSTLLVGVVVAGMIVIVIIVVLKKNWSRISGNRPATDRPTVPNGTAPEEVPLREKPNPV